MKRIFITGAAGFCGVHLAAHLRRKGGCKIFAGFHNPSKLPLTGIPVKFDITSESSVAKVIRDIRPDYVYHLAAQSNARLSAQIADQTYRVNILGTINVANAILRHSPQARLLYTSSVHVYGKNLRNGKWVSEKTFLWPENYYGYSKALSEFACLELHRRFGLNVVIARANNYFGPGQRPDFVFSDWCRQIALIEAGRQQAVITVGDLSLRRDFLYVQDGVELYERLMRRGEAGSLYNVSSGKSFPLSRFLSFLLSHSKMSISVHVDEKRFRSDDPPAVLISNARVKRLGWKPRFSLESSLLTLLNVWRRQIQNE